MDRRLLFASFAIIIASVIQFSSFRSYAVFISDGKGMIYKDDEISFSVHGLFNKDLFKGISMDGIELINSELLNDLEKIEYEDEFTKDEYEQDEVDEIPKLDLSGIEGPNMQINIGDDLTSQALDGGFDIPVVMNETVQYFIEYFTTKIKKKFSIWLSRSSRYVPMMKRIFSAFELPEDLVYLALIESGFHPHAKSWARAVGPWQFIYGTAKRYGLKIDRWVDERRDPEKSTYAAALYLKDLFNMFNSWYLAMAGYNAGEYTIMRSINKFGTSDFWELAKYKSMRRETKEYIPKLIAALIIAKNPEKYGFIDINYEEPWRFDSVYVPGGVNLRAVALACNVSYEEIKHLNPALIRGYTPPYAENYEIRIPYGKLDEFEKNFPIILSKNGYLIKNHNESVIHIVKKGETLSSIGKRYRVSVRKIKSLNHIKNPSRIRPGQRLIIYENRNLIKGKKVHSYRADHSVSQMREKRVVFHTVRSGETLYSISKRYGVSINSIKEWNEKRGNKIIKGEVLKILKPVKPSI